MKTISALITAIFISGGFLLGCGSENPATDTKSLKLATSAEWTERSDGLPGFQEHYGFEFTELAVVDLGLAYQAVGTGLADVGVGDATEGRIAVYELVVLEDDRQYFPAYNPAPIVRREILEIHPGLADTMNELSSGLTLETLTMLNKQVAVDEIMPQQVAQQYLVEQGLINNSPSDSNEKKDVPIIVSSKTFTEALTLGYLTRFLLEDRGYTVTDEIGLGEVSVITPALFSGRVDIYWEYTGTGLMNVMGHDEVITDPQECYERVRDWYMKNHDVVWLAYAPANNTFVLFTSKELHEEHGWTKISDLAAYLNQ
jgi:osmoprotectant transport system substrate-binding protein